MARVIVWRVESLSQIPEDDPAAGKKNINLRSLTEEQKNYFREAHDAFRQNVSCWEFDREWYMNGNSRFYDVVPERGAKVVDHPLWKALQELWLALGANQGHMAVAGPERNETIYFWL